MLEKDAADSENEEKFTLDHQSIPGSCKSHYALKFKLETDIAIENFIQVSDIPT